MNDVHDIFDWLLPLEEDEQFLGGLKKKLGENNPIGGTEFNYEIGDLGEEDENERS